jgi:hypothetical protein
MFRITSKVKIAAGLAAGALTLGAVGAYAAGTIPASSLKTVTLSGPAGTLKLNSTNGETTALTIPATFENLGQCVSLFAKHQDLVLQPAAGTTRISKNSHGKLISTIKAFCEPLVTATKTDGAETSDATDSTDSTTSQGNGHGHSKHARQTD